MTLGQRIDAAIAGAQELEVDTRSIERFASRHIATLEDRTTRLAGAGPAGHVESAASTIKSGPRRVNDRPHGTTEVPRNARPA